MAQKWSPWGKEVVFSSDRGGNFDLFSRAADGSGDEGVKGGVNLDHFGGAKVDQLVKG